VEQWSLDLLGVPRLSDHLAAVDDQLIGACSAGDPGLSSASRRVVAAGGKRLRPALTIATAGLGQVSDVRVIEAATAVELVQVGSLVHDDIFDEALTRRGTPTINAVEGPNEALLAGTVLLARAASKAASAGQRVAQEVAHAVARLCLGQLTETEHLFDVEQLNETYLSTIEMKTAALFACACRVGAITGELPDEDVDSLGEFGLNFGMSFQLVDDILDLIGDPDRMGKPVGSDLQNGVLTLPILLELTEARDGQLARLLLRRHPSDLERGARLVIASGRVDETKALARQFAANASTAISGMQGLEVENLSRFGSSYVDWALERFASV
jgi:geranylgeranyl pyrophosphate synthase